MKKIFMISFCIILLTGCGIKTSDSIIIVTSPSVESTSIAESVSGSEVVSDEPVQLPITLVINKNLPSTWTYITNNPSYPNPAYYDGGGLKLNYYNIGLISQEFSPVDEAHVTLSIGSMDGRKNPQGGAEHVFEIKGLDALGETLDTKYQDSIVVGDLGAVTLSGEGIVKVSIIMIGYFEQSGSNQTLELNKIIIA